jgi:hypothetical protein
MAIGNARSLDEVLQSATTELVRWRDHDCARDIRAASILLDQTMEYETANVFDPPTWSWQCSTSAG